MYNAAKNIFNFLFFCATHRNETDDKYGLYTTFTPCDIVFYQLCNDDRIVLYLTVRIYMFAFSLFFSIYTIWYHTNVTHIQ